MNPPATTPELHPRSSPRNAPHPTPQHHRIPPSQPRQQTLWGFITNHLSPQGPLPMQPTPDPITIPETSPTPLTPINTPTNTPLNCVASINTQPPSPQCIVPQQRPLWPDRTNDPWGDCWAMKQPTNLFRVVSKNTGTINLPNMDMLALTKELMLISASVFAAQETNIHWNVDTIHHLQTQCCKAAPQTQIATSTSAEDTSEWHKPGGTITMALNNWTSRVIKKGNDPMLGRWSFIELVRKYDKHLIVISAYRVCHQQFDTASQTVMAQQI